jgi:hypothetical protein
MRQSSKTSSGLDPIRWLRSIARRAVIPATVLVIGGSVMLAFGSGSTPFQVVMLVVAVGLLIYSVVGLGLRFAGLDADALDIAGHLAHDPDQKRLLVRWLTRARWARFVGGFSGVAVWLLGTNARGDILMLGAGGTAAGAMLAELHQMRPRKGPRVARLDVRSVGDYLSYLDVRRMAIVGAAAASLIIAGLPFGGDNAATASWGLAALGTLGITYLAQLRVAGRARPAVADKLISADDLIRELAIGRGLAMPATVFAITLVSHGCRSLGGGWQGVGNIAWIYALLVWWNNRRLGLDHLATEFRQPAVA